MQKKQVKIMGFQAENCKIKLFYETDGENSRYIVERNRKYILITKDLNKAKKKFTTEIANNVLQLDLYEQNEEDYKLVIMDYSKLYGYQAKFQLSKEQATKLIKTKGLIKDPDETYLPSWYTKERYETVIKKIKKQISPA